MDHEKWISVKERLPEVDHENGYSRSVLASDENGNMAVAWISTLNSDDGEWATDNGNLPNIVDVKFWTELPAPPK